MSKIILHFSNQQEIASFPNGIRRVIKKCCEGVLAEEEFDDLAEVSVTIVDDAEIQRLNEEFRNINCPTDVLSFPMGDDDGFDVNPETDACILGDIVISLEKAILQAEEYGHSLEREIGFLTTHSMLHLFGYDHVNDPEGEKTMISKQEKILDKLGITREISDKREA